MCNIFNKIITETFPNLEKTMPIKVRKPPDLQIDLTKIELPHNILSLKQQVQRLETYKGKPIKITADFSTETLKARRAWGEVFQALNENNFNPRILYPAKLLFKIDRAIKAFHDKQNLKQCMTKKLPLQKILQGILHTENETQHNQWAGNTKLQEKKEEESRE
jgi:hypothetical protein